MTRIVLLLAAAMFVRANAEENDLPKVSSGRIERIENFPSKHVDSRNVDVWLPEQYSNSRKYAVIYMHDGQMLFDSTRTWNKQEWQVDEVLTALLKQNRTRDCIVVGIWNNGQFRHSEYFPQVVLGSIPWESRKLVIHDQLKEKPQADNYLKFIVGELKPYIDERYPTMADAENTFVMGSSMGGLISLYALCEYPGIFGGAACLSINWPVVHHKITDRRTIELFSSVFRAYLNARLPTSGNKKIYYDIGSLGLDSLYRPHQLIVDEMMTGKGLPATTWMSREFVGEDHTEQAWGRRLSIPLEFLLRKP